MNTTKVNAKITEITPLKSGGRYGAAIHYRYTVDGEERPGVYKCFPLRSESSPGYITVVCSCLYLFGREDINEIQSTPEEINKALESLGRSGDKFSGMEVVAVLGGKFGTYRLEETQPRQKNNREEARSLAVN